MKSIAKAMYVVGLVMNIIAIITCLVLTIIFGALMNNQGFLEQLVQNDTSGTLTSIEYARLAMSIYFVVFLVITIIEAPAIFIGVMGIKKVNDDKPRQNAFHIVALVFGFLCGGLFYILGGIFGLIAENEKPA